MRSAVNSSAGGTNRIRSLGGRHDLARLDLRLRRHVDERLLQRRRGQVRRRRQRVAAPCRRPSGRARC